MNYQPSPPVEPVVVCMGRALVAFDHASGGVVWNFVAEAAIERLFRVGPRVLASSGESVVCVDLATGRLVGTVKLGFSPDAGLVCGTDLILADGASSATETPRVACVTSDGSIRWRATVATDARSGENVLRTYGIDGAKRSEIRYGRTGYRAGILYAGAVAQPDRS
jgi:outer membrane protein assembly factor BamB